MQQIIHIYLKSILFIIQILILNPHSIRKQVLHLLIIHHILDTHYSTRSDELIDIHFLIKS